MTRRLPLSLRVLLLACLNVALLAGFFLVFARVEYRFNLASFLLAPARATVASVSRLIAIDLSETAPRSWNSVLSRYESRYPAHFFLFDHRATQLAGQPLKPFDTILSGIRNDPFASDDHEPRRPIAPGPEPRHPEGEDPIPQPGPISHFDEDDDRPPPPPTMEDRPMPRDHDPRSPPRRAPAENDRRSAAPVLVRSPGHPGYWVCVRFPLWQPGADAPIHATLVWQIPSIWREPVFFDFRPWLIVVITFLLSLLICWLPFLHNLTSTIRRITGVTGRIADGHFDVQLPVRRSDELGELSRAIHQMSKRLAGYVHGQKRFSGDIAHELSSPIARIQAGLGILEQRVEGDSALYVSDVRDDVEHMSILVGELLAFSKAQDANSPAELTVVSIAPLLDGVLRREGGQSIQVHDSVSHLPPVTAVSDCLERALANLIRNALRYAGNAGPIEIRGSAEADTVVLVVADSGRGIAEEELEHVFRAFYRPEVDRGRDSGGTGLGLAIVRDCMEACRGSIHLRNRVPCGLEAVIRLHAAT